MRKLLLMCLVSGFVGALMALCVARDGPAMRLMAQERSAAITAPAAGSSGADELADFSAAERVNIAVYENANRGVVNITTRMARQQSFFFDEGRPSEGSGSGSVLD